MDDKSTSEREDLQSKLLESILTMQNDFLERGIYYGWCMSTIENMLILSESQFGFICELLEKDDGTPYLRSHGISSIAWNEKTRQFYEQYKEQGLEFFNFDGLWSKAITTGEPVIANDPDNDGRRGGYPKESGHPALKSFLAIPIKGAKGRVVGVMGVANRSNGYNNEVVEFLHPFVASYGVLIEKHRAEKELEYKQRISRQYLDVAGVMMLALDLDGNVTLINPKGCEILGCERDEIVGKNWFEEFLDSHDIEEVKSVFNRITSGDIEPVEYYENAVLRRDGRRRLIAWHNSILHEPDGKIAGLFSSGEDITERKLTEEELRRYEWLQEKEESKPQQNPEYRFAYRDPVELNTSRVILDAVGKETLELMARDVMILLDTSLAIYEANGDYACGAFNSAWCQSMDNASFKLCGSEDTQEALAGGKWLCHENCWNDSAKAAIESGEPTDIDCVGGIRLYAVPIRAGEEIIGAINIGYSNPPKDDKTISELAEEYRMDADHLRELSNQYKPRPEFIINVAKSRCDSMAKMIGQLVERHRFELEKEQLQKQLLQSQKMESIGKLAGGIAHDFNNLLTAIQGFSDLVQTSLNPEDPVKEDVAEIQKAADSAASLTNQLLAYSRKQIISPKVTDLNRIISHSENMLRRIIGEDIDVVLSPADNIGKVLVDRGQINQILINLSVNSREAMPDGGKFTIETANVTLDEKECQTCGNPFTGDFVMFAVSDNGVGIDRKTVLKIFDPFFTTRDAHSGLGLSTVHGIVHQNRGHINVYSEPGIGTTFKVYFPLVRDQAESALENEEPVRTRGNETILLVEDQDVVRKVAARTLKKEGYQVIEAENGGEALAGFEERREDIELLLTDVVMPTMNGKELYERLLEIKPNLKALFMSGYTEDVIARHGVLDENTNFIQKPYTSKELAKKVRQVLDSDEYETGSHTTG